jgi:hypothetical protein
MRLLGSCFPLVLSFLIAAVLVAPAGPSASVAASAGVSLGVSAAQSASPAAVHAEAQVVEPVAPVVTAPRSAIVAAEPRTLHETGVRAPAAPRGPPHHLV